MTAAVRLGIGGIVLVLCLTAALSVREVTKPAPLWPVTTFSPSVWREAPKSRRYHFYNDLVGSGVLIGLTEAEVVDRLGEPDGRGSNLHVLHYTIYERDPSWTAPGGEEYRLSIQFDSNGRVHSVSRDALM